MEQCWWNSEIVIVEQWNSDGGRVLVEQWNSDSTTVSWNTGTVMVEQCWWNRVGGTVKM